MTDALCMMGIRAKYGRTECMGLALAAGQGPLPYLGVGNYAPADPGGGGEGLLRPFFAGASHGGGSGQLRR